MSSKVILSTIQVIKSRSASGGGYSEQASSPSRTDATAWAVLAMKAIGGRADLQDSARSYLASEQHTDGRICLAKEQPQTLWPTSLALLAWNGSDAYQKNRDLAIQFLLGVTGKHWKRENNSPLEHDPSIKGWPWIENTFAWVEPTVLSILALRLCGYDQHPRVQEAMRLLMDRQLPGGGWNYGNTLVYGQELYPQPESTGMALVALAGRIEKNKIARSLHHMKSQIVSIRSPLSLGWGLFGLGAWNERPAEAERWLVECLSRQNKFGAYGTSLLSLLLLAYKASGGFLETVR